MKYGPTRWDQTNLNPVRVGKWPAKVFKQWVEDAASGSTVIQTAAVEAAPVGSMSSAGDKVEKAIALATMYESDRVFHLAGASWRNDFEEELVAFPNTAHDDRTDAAGMCGRLATEDRALRLGLATLEEVAEDYPEFAAWKAKEDAEEKARNAEHERMRAEAIAAVGMDDPKKKRKPNPEDDDKPEPKSYKINVAGGDLELPAD
jgi:predicted phage terminase large subunit-like protein